ncbi:hypothetical protein GYMLUDRAFT_240695 [Collybiopsis luxurians FD-317 M1]|nr:hypothetical protein GYMLUDRAFT_240695 [Collybiopsis luxurians FD-317 M1]
MAIKLMIAWELFIDTAHTALSVYMLWAYVVDNFDSKAYILTNPWHLTFPPALTALSACPIQIFLSLRVKKLSGRWIVFAALVTLTLIEGSLVIATSVIYTQAKNWTVAKRYNPLVDSSRAVTAATDIAISACLIYYLQKSRNGLPQTDYLISRFIREAIETGSFASLFAILIIITPKQNLQQHAVQLIFMVFSIPMGRIYTNTFLAILNSRQSLRRELHDNSYTKSTVTQSYGSNLEPVSQESRIHQNHSIVSQGRTGTSGVISNRITTTGQSLSIALTEIEDLTLPSSAGSI